MQVAAEIDSEDSAIECSVPARAGLLGNPSDGYGGRTLALAVTQFEATVRLVPSREVRIVTNPSDEAVWASPGAFAQHIDRFGTGIGAQAIAAGVRTFMSVLESLEHGRYEGFTLSYGTTIPRQVGLAGSSALVLATMMCLEEHTGVSIPREVLPSLALAAEADHLGVVAGLQDRVVQTYGGLVAMDFGSLEVDAKFGVSHGSYRHLDPATLPPLYLAYSLHAAEPSDVYHRSLRRRFDNGDPIVRDVMRQLAAVAVEGEAALRWHNAGRFGELVGRNMELRRALGPLPEQQEALVSLAEELESPATLAGSGGAIVGVYRDQAQYDLLTGAFGAIGATVVSLTP